MRAAVLRPGAARLQVEELPDPTPRRGEVLVRVRACGVCHTDLHVIKDEVAFPKPAVLGHELSGVVEAVGEDVDGLTVGDRVASAFIMPCGTCRHCVRGLDDLCEKFFAYNRLSGVLYDGTSRLTDAGGETVAMYSMAGLAELAVVPATDVFRVPDGVSLADAAIIGCSVFTAYGAVRNVANLRVGETVAVIAVGGVGLNLVQVAALFGASKVIAVDLDPDKLELAARLGATHTIDASQQDAAAAIRELTGGRGVDVAFEAIGSASTVRTAVDSLDDGGRAVLVGIAPAGVTAELPIAHLVRRKIQVLGSYGARTRTDMPAVLELVERGAITLDLIRDRFPLERAPEAYELLDQRRIVGRAIIDMEA